MKTKHCTLLLHPAFLCCLAVLLLNDLYLKYAFHNGLTGKLSDVTGLFVFTVFLQVLFPGYKKITLLLSAVFFCWWKSPFSDGMIALLTRGLALPVHRVVDYTDYIALPVLLFAYYLKPPVYTVSFLRPVAICLSGIISFFAFCATSMPRYMQKGDTYINKTVRTRQQQTAIEDKFREKNIPITRDTAYYIQQDTYNQYLEIKDSATGRYDTLRLSDHKEIKLYRRSLPYDPSYTIPYLLINRDTLKDVRFSIEETPNAKKRIIRLRSFRYDTIPPQGYFVSQYWLKRKYQKPLKKKTEAILQ
jgi:hypothetical protein